MDLIGLLIAILLFCLVAYGLYWVCQQFSLPQPIQWLIGIILVIVLLLYITGYPGIGIGGRGPPRWR